MNIYSAPRTLDEVIWYFDSVLMRDILGHELSKFIRTTKTDEKGFYTYNQVDNFINVNEMWN
jgi:hypothetical protein